MGMEKVNASVQLSLILRQPHMKPVGYLLFPSIKQGEALHQELSINLNEVKVAVNRRFARFGAFMPWAHATQLAQEQEAVFDPRATEEQRRQVVEWMFACGVLAPGIEERGLLAERISTALKRKYAGTFIENASLTGLTLRAMAFAANLYQDVAVFGQHISGELPNQVAFERRIGGRGSSKNSNFSSLN